MSLSLSAPIDAIPCNRFPCPKPYNWAVRLRRDETHARALLLYQRLVVVVVAAAAAAAAAAAVAAAASVCHAGRIVVRVHADDELQVRAACG
jgi:hypothetical protein